MKPNGNNRHRTVTEVLTSFGRHVKEARRRAGFTQEELADRLELTANFVAHLERGSRAPSIETLVSLSDVLKVPIPGLFEGAVAPAPIPRDTAAYRRLCAVMKRVPPKLFPQITRVAAALAPAHKS